MKTSGTVSVTVPDSLSARSFLQEIFFSPESSIAFQSIRAMNLSIWIVPGLEIFWPQVSQTSNFERINNILDFFANRINPTSDFTDPASNRTKHLFRRIFVDALFGSNA